MQLPLPLTGGPFDMCPIHLQSVFGCMAYLERTRLRLCYLAISMRRIVALRIRPLPAYGLPNTQRKFNFRYFLHM